MMMRCVPCEANGDEVCANCGKLGSDAVKLKNCTACRLVKYCGVDCQRAHRKKHKKACKRRAAELKDERLYSQGQERPEGDFCSICTLPIPLPTGTHSGINVCCTKRICDGCLYSQGQERPEGDFCPICTLPILLPLADGSVFFACCVKRVCHGCTLAAQKRGMHDCPFCRTPRQEDDKSALAMIQKRVDAKDPAAITFLANQYYLGGLGLEKDATRAFELWKVAAGLGSIDAHNSLGSRYFHGVGVTYDIAKAVQHWETAAMKGITMARCDLGTVEYQIGNPERAVRHYLIAAKMGDKTALNNIKEMFVDGCATKAQYAEALKGYQDSLDEMKSPERDEAYALLRQMNSAREQEQNQHGCI